MPIGVSGKLGVSIAVFLTAVNERIDAYVDASSLESFMIPCAGNPDFNFVIEPISSLSAPHSSLGWSLAGVNIALMNGRCGCCG